MNDNTMPAAEAEGVVDREPVAYELAFHVLPTVAEGEVTKVTDTLRHHITGAGGEIFDHEAPQRFDLAYDIVKYLEGRNRSFSSAYFGWVRFRLTPAALGGIVEAVAAEKELLRYLLIRLNRDEEKTPFRFHEALAATRVTTITEEDVVAVEEVAEVVPEVEAAAAEASSEVVKE